nr:MAG TPA: hypothetical protein [Bacteriophage sp.]
MPPCQKQQSGTVHNYFFDFVTICVDIVRTS